MNTDLNISFNITDHHGFTDMAFAPVYIQSSTLVYSWKEIWKGNTISWQIPTFYTEKQYNTNPFAGDDQKPLVGYIKS